MSEHQARSRLPSQLRAAADNVLIPLSTKELMRFAADQLEHTQRKRMDHKINGTDVSALGPTLTEAKQAFTDAALEEVKHPSGHGYAVNPLEMYINQLIDQHRITMLAEAMIDAGLLDQADLMARTVRRLVKDTKDIQARVASKPRLIAPA